MSALAGLVGGTVHALITLAALRLQMGVPPLVTHVASALLVHLASTIMLMRSVPDPSYWHMASLYWFLVMIYLYGYNAFYKSLSLRILAFIAAPPSHPKKSQEILERVIRPSFCERAEILMNAHLVEKSAATYGATEKGIKTAARLRGLRKFLRIEGGGIYFD